MTAPHPAKTILLLSGLSGAGKTTALKTLEDMGWEVVDNLPLSLLDPLLETPLAAGAVGAAGVSLCMLDDMRALCAGLPLADVQTTFAVDAPASILMLMYRLVSEESGVAAAALGGAAGEPCAGASAAHHPLALPQAPPEAAQDRAGPAAAP